jgi:hypothetical protein
MPFVRSVCGELWNFELFEKTLKHQEGEFTKEQLRARLDFLSGLDGSCECDFRIVASHFWEFEASVFDRLRPSVLEGLLSDPGLVIRDEDSLFEFIHRRVSEDLSYFGLLEFVRFEFLSDECMARALECVSNSFESLTFGIWSRLRTRLALSVTPPKMSGRFKALPTMESTIISATPEIFSVIGGKTFRLLYRGSRDGFQPSAFHSHCDGHQNTVSLILSKNKCIFGGYTPLAWSSQTGYVSDPSLRRFVFTIKNPHGLPAQIFRQKLEANAIYNGSPFGPTFGNHDFRVYEPFQSSTYNYSSLGTAYTNDTGIDGQRLLTGEYSFVVEEIEVFEVL